MCKQNYNNRNNIAAGVGGAAAALAFASAEEREGEAKGGEEKGKEEEGQVEKRRWRCPRREIYGFMVADRYGTHLISSPRNVSVSPLYLREASIPHLTASRYIPCRRFPSAPPVSLPRKPAPPPTLHSADSPPRLVQRSIACLFQKTTP